MGYLFNFEIIPLCPVFEWKSVQNMDKSSKYLDVIQKLEH